MAYKTSIILKMKIKIPHCRNSYKIQ